MDEIDPSPAEPGFAVHAYGELRAEVSLLRRAVERLTDERTSQPDYGSTLEATGRSLEDIRAWARRMADAPALKLTPEVTARQLAEAASQARASDREMLKHAAASMEAASHRIDALVVRARSEAEQVRELNRNRIAFSVAGMVLFAILPGAIARSLPISWAVPERIAARMLGTDMWSAGQNMMAKADPARWRHIVDRQRDRPRGSLAR